MRIAWQSFSAILNSKANSSAVEVMAVDFILVVLAERNQIGYTERMANFIIIPLSKGNQKLNSLIPTKFGNDSYCLENGDWLVSYSGTSKQLSDELGITTDEKETAVVFSFTGYWGRAKPDIWEWLNEHSK